MCTPYPLDGTFNRAMQVDKDQTIQELQRQIDELTADNLLLREQLESKEQFTAMIAHELRSPLSPIINYAQMLSRHTCEPVSSNHHSYGGGTQTTSGKQARNVPIQKYTNIIIGQAQRLTRLVNDLLEASLLSSGQFTLVRQPFDIVAMARECVEQLRPLALYRTLVLEAPDTPIVGAWDGGRLQQALGNLLDNAIKYSDENTVITVKLWTTAHMVHVSVHDYGLVIQSSEADQLFRPYGRLSGTSRLEGSGLGLYITKNIIEAHGGVLRLEPRTAGPHDLQGTTFSFDLPL